MGELRRSGNAILRAVTEIAREFLQNDQWEKNVTSILGQLGRAARVCRVCVFANTTLENGEPAFLLRYEWIAPHTASYLVDSSRWEFGVPYPWKGNTFERWASLLGRGEVIAGPVDHLPPQEADALRQQGVRSVAAVPIFVGEKWWGFIAFDECTHPRLWTDDELDALRSASSILSSALERKRMLDQLEQHTAEMDILSQILRALNATPHVDEAFPRIVKPLRRLTQAERISITLFVENNAAFVVTSLDAPNPKLGKGTRLPIEATSAASDILNGRIHLTPDLAEETDWPAEQLLYRAGYRSRVNIPLTVQDRVYGALNFAWSYPHGFDHVSIPLLQRLADAIALAIERTHHLEREQNRRQEMESLFRTAAALTTNLELEEILEHILNYLEELTHYDSATILLVEDDHLRVQAMRGFEHPEVYMARRYPLEDPYFRRISETGEPILLEDAMADPHFENWDDHYPIRGWLAVPLVVRDKVIGYLTLESRKPGAFGEKETRLAQVFANHAAAAIENARLYRQAVRLNQELEQALQARTLLIHRISHELRTPLTLILGLAELLQSNPEVATLSEPTRQLIANLVQEARHLRHMVNQVLTLKQVEHDPLNIQPIDVRAWLEHTAQVWTPVLAQKDQRLHVDIAPDVGEVQGDRTYLQQVMDNLLDNAHKYTPPGRDIHITARREGDHVLIQVRDEGIGVPPDMLDQLFEQFYRVERKETYQNKGLGLGLALCRQIVERHGGRIWAESEGEGRGLTVSFTLPY